ncbi:MAG: hypothetical protein JST27_07955 [Bacteroidetes bacterium]|nr:hypothetical protein [Bacteroidota bacterium]
MKRWKLSLLSLTLSLTAFGLVLFGSCEVDPCTQLSCKNGSACTEGYCRCPTGYEGAECEIKTSQKFIGTFIGYNHCDDYPAMNDTLVVYQVAEPNVLEFHLLHNNPTGLYRGVADGNRIVVPEVVSNGNTINAQATINHDDINVVFSIGSGPGNISECVFNGHRN